MNYIVCISYSCNIIITGVIVVCNHRSVAIYTGFMAKNVLENTCEFEPGYKSNYFNITKKYHNQIVDAYIDDGCNSLLFF